MKRREFIIVIGVMVSIPFAGRSQQPPKLHRVAFVGAGPPVSQLLKGPVAEAFLEGLHELGYIEGKNLSLEWHSAEGKYERSANSLRPSLM